MATLRKWLEKAGADFDNLKIVYQEVKGSSSPGWETPINAEFISADHPILDKEFYDGYGGPECPRIIADDGENLYFPGTYDGATWLEVVSKDISTYLDEKILTPYPGGG